MLTIKLTGPGVYTAKDGEEVLGHCRFSLKGDTLAILEVEILEPDPYLLDGLLRAALFYGYERGCSFGMIAEEAAETQADALAQLGLKTGVKLKPDDLPRHCGG